MQVSLDNSELEYFKTAVFWDWKKIEIDLEFAKSCKSSWSEAKRAKLEEQAKWYRTLWTKLGGETAGEEK